MVLRIPLESPMLATIDNQSNSFVLMDEFVKEDPSLMGWLGES